MGNKEDSGTLMGGSHVTGSHSKRQAGIPESIKLPSHDGHPAFLSVGDILDEDPIRSEVLDNSLKLIPKGALADEVSGWSDNAESLTRKSPDQNEWMSDDNAARGKRAFSTF